MVVKTAKDLEKVQQQLSEQLGRLQGDRPGARTGTPAEDPRLLIEQARARLDAAIRDRDEGLRVADLRIATLKAELASFERSAEPAVRPAAVSQPRRSPKAKGRT
jgi:hypothetical protein